MRRKKIPLLWLVFFFGCTPLIAQDSYISLSLGGTFPQGSYAETNTLGNDGFAGSSFTMAFDGNYFFGLIGLGGTLNFGMSYLDAEKLQPLRTEHLQTVYPTAPIPLDATVDLVNTQWNYVNLMGGPLFSIPLSVINIEFKAFGGVSFVMPPVQDLTITSGTTTWTSKASGQSLHLGYQVGTALLYHPNPGYGIRIGVDYIGTSGKYNMHYDLDQGNAGSNEVVEKEEIPVRVIHATVGIFYNF